MSVCLYTHRLSWNWQSAGSLRAGQTHGPLWSQISTWSSWTLKNGKIETDEGLMWLMFPDPDKPAEKTHRRWETSNRNTRSISGVRCFEQIHGDPVKELWASVNEKTTEVSGTYRRTGFSSFTSGTFTAWSTLRRKKWRQSINSNHLRNQNSESHSNQMFQIADGAADDLNIWCISAGVGWTQEFHSGINLLCSESRQNVSWYLLYITKCTSFSTPLTAVMHKKYRTVVRLCYLGVLETLTVVEEELLWCRSNRMKVTITITIPNTGCRKDVHGQR